MTLEIEFRPGRADKGDGVRLLQAMRDEMAELYDGMKLDANRRRPLCSTHG